MRRRILTAKEQEDIFNLNYSDKELEVDFNIENADLVKVGRMNKDYNKLGYLLQKYILKSRGFTTSTFDWEVPDSLIEYICNQIGVDSNVDIGRYSRTNRLEDFKSIMKELGYQKDRKSVV